MRIEKLTRQGIQLMQEERNLALRGDLDGLAELNEKKSSFLEQMEALAEATGDVGPADLRESRKQELATLFSIIQRRAAENQHLLRAVQAGVRGAQQKISSLLETTESLGIYGSNGAPVGPTTPAPRKSGVY